MGAASDPQYCSAMPGPFEQLDFLYMPSRDVAADAKYWTEVLGGSLIFAVDGMGTRVAMVELTQPRRASCWPAISTARRRSSSTAWRTCAGP